MRVQNLNTKFLGRNSFFYDKLDSTQLEIWRRVQNNKIINGMIVLADIQTEGKRDSWQKVAYNTRKQYSFFIFLGNEWFC